MATACITLGRLMGLRVWVTSRDATKRAKALELGAHEAFESGARLPHRVDAVMETVGAATWDHSLKSLVPGGRLVVSGATSGSEPQPTCHGCSSSSCPLWVRRGDPRRTAAPGGAAGLLGQRP